MFTTIQKPIQPLSTGERVATLAAVLIAASSGPVLLVAADAGYGSLHDLGLWIILPSVIVMAFLGMWSKRLGWNRLSSGIRASLWIGILATIGLDVVREIGFRLFHSMPGDISMLVGVLLTDRFMDGPDLFSNVLGEMDHLWNGVTFAAIFLLVLGRQKLWASLIYAFLIAVAFMTSPVVQAMGAGSFGRDFGPGFAVTVFIAHGVFGLVLGLSSRRSAGVKESLWKMW